MQWWKDKEFMKKFDLGFYLNTVEHRLDNFFPDDYYESPWYSWEQRIQDGHDAQEKEIGNTYKELIDSGEEGKTIVPDHDIYLYISDDLAVNSEITNAMYAALIVSVWSAMEHFFKHLLSICYWSHNLKGIVPYKIEEIENAFQNLMSIQIDQCACYNIVDATRILNNRFKHNNGRYAVGKRDKNEIVKPLLDQWGALNTSNEIDYSKIPLEKIVSSCNAFCRCLLDKVKTGLKPD